MMTRRIPFSFRQDEDEQQAVAIVARLEGKSRGELARQFIHEGLLEWLNDPSKLEDYLAARRAELKTGAAEIAATLQRKR